MGRMGGLAWCESSLLRGPVFLFARWTVWSLIALTSIGSTRVATSATGPIQVQLLPKVSVLGPNYTVGDVAQVAGNDEYRCETLKKVVVGRAPIPDHSTAVDAMAVRVVLRRAGYGVPDVTVLDGRTIVTTAGQNYPLQNLLPLIRTDVLRATGEAPGDVTVDPSPAFEKVLVLPKGKVTIALRPPASGRFEGSVMYLVDLSVDGRKIRTLPMRVTVKIEKTAVVVTRRVERGEKFGDSSIELRKVESGVDQESVTVLSQALGKVSARAVFPGTVLRFQDIADPPVIKRGQAITCRSAKGNVEIEVTVQAMEDGRVGRVIRVQNTGSKKLFKARVIDESTVVAVAGP